MNDHMFDLTTFGETMLRLSPPNQSRLSGAPILNAQYGGSESNLAANLAHLNRRVRWFSRLPDNPLGHGCAAAIQAHGVDVSAIPFVLDARMGLYFIETGSPPRPTRVWYDRAHSAASHLTPADLPADLWTNSRWLHLSGITVALSHSCRAAAQFALEQARAAKIKTSFDVNYRALLWSADSAAAACEPFCRAVDVVFIALRDAVMLFNAPHEVVSAAEILQIEWGGAVFVTDGANGAAACDGKETVNVPAIPVTIVDRIGAGDAFAAGVLDVLIGGGSLHHAARSGVALAALALTIPGDIAAVSRPELDAVLNADAASLQR